MGALDWVEPGIAVVGAALGAAFVVQQWNARRRARGRRFVTAQVTSVSRNETDRRHFPWQVETTYELPGGGIRSHHAGFETEGKAILFSRLHREGTRHDVVPHPSKPGEVFLREELAVTDWNLVALGGLMVFAAVLAAWGLMEYFDE